jgi:hypothetical protein
MTVVRTTITIYASIAGISSTRVVPLARTVSSAAICDEQEPM